MSSSFRYFPYNPRPPYPTPDPTGNYTTSLEDVDHGGLVDLVYKYLISSISAIGIVGNLAVIFVLRQKRFNSGFMYAYMRGLAVIDTCYLIYCLQASYLVSQHYFLVADYRAAATRGLATYVWRALSPIWQSFSRASDLVVTFVTVDRYRVMRRVDQLNGQDNRATTRVGDSHAIGGGVVFRRRLWRVRCQMVAALAVGLALNTPYCFQFTIEPCSDDPRSQDCYVPAITAFSLSSAWFAYSVAYQLGLTLAPYTIVLVLNVAMLAMLRTVWRRQRALKATISDNINGGGGGGGSGGSNGENDGVNNSFSARTVATISNLFMRPPLVIGSRRADGSTDEVTASALGRLRARLANLERQREARWQKKNAGKRTAFFLLTKLSSKEARMTALLLTVTACHILLTLPGNITYFVWTVFPEEWGNANEQTVAESISDLLSCINYSVNFYLYCVADSEVRAAVKEEVGRAVAMYRRCTGRGSKSVQ